MRGYIFMVLIAFCLIVQSIAFNPEKERKYTYPDDGILQPDPYYERYRRSEYNPDEPFFQWWYFCIRDVESDLSWAFSYNTLDPMAGNNSAYYQLFSFVDHSSQPAKTLQKYEKFDFEDISIKDYFTVNVMDGNSVVYSLTPLDNNTYRITGYMNHSENVFTYENCDKDLYVEWDLTITRIYGWYGFNSPLEEIDYEFGRGVLLWNTYSHNSFVEGYIKIGDQTYNFQNSSQFRAYCDMNWGEKYLESGPYPATEYPWGWYYINIPNKDFSQDISVIAGYGLTEFGFPVYSVSCSVLDMRLNSTYHVGARDVSVLVGTPDEISVFHTSNDVDLLAVNVSRGNWVSITDKFGTGTIPLEQTIYFETGHHQITMEFYSSLDEYNRLLYPYKDCFFSDFEALGVKAHLLVVHDGMVIMDMWTEDAGVEFGYKASVSL